MAKAILFLDRRRPNSKGEFIVKIRLTHKRNYTFISKGFYCSEKDFIKRNFKNKLNDQENVDINAELAEIQKLLIDKKHLLDELSVEQIKTMYLTPSETKVQEIKNEIISDSISLETWGKKIIDRANNAKSYKTANWYKDCVSAFVKFNKGDILLKDISPTFLKDFESYRTGLGNAVNGISAHLRALRALLNKANEENIGINNEPFRKFKIKTQTTKKRAIPIEFFQKFRAYEIPNLNSTNLNLLKSAKTLEQTKNIFLFSFDTRGMNFIDIAKLKLENFKDVVIVNGQLVSANLDYQRSKLKRGSNPENFNIRLTQSCINVLNYFNFTSKTKDECIFPFGWEDSKKGSENYRQKLKRINKRFKSMMSEIGYDEEVSSYWIRHSWASIARQSGVSIEQIGAGLGHKSFETTKVYLTNFEESLIDDMNDKIVNLTINKQE